MHPAIQAYHAHNERARRLNTEAAEAARAREAAIGPAAYAAELAAEDARQAHYHEEEQEAHS